MPMKAALVLLRLLLALRVQAAEDTDAGHWDEHIVQYARDGKMVMVLFYPGPDAEYNQEAIDDLEPLLASYEILTEENNYKSRTMLYRVACKKETKLCEKHLGNIQKSKMIEIAYFHNKSLPKGDKIAYTKVGTDLSIERLRAFIKSWNIALKPPCDAITMNGCAKSEKEYVVKVKGYDDAQRQKEYEEVKGKLDVIDVDFKPLEKTVNDAEAELEDITGAIKKMENEKTEIGTKIKLLQPKEGEIVPAQLDVSSALSLFREELKKMKGPEKKEAVKKLEAKKVVLETNILKKQNAIMPLGAKYAKNKKELDKINAGRKKIFARFTMLSAIMKKNTGSEEL